MRLKWLASFSLLAICFAVTQATPVSAASLKISPLRYDATLKEGEKQKGFVDISNPTAETTKIKLTVQGFRQTNNNGALEFYDSEALRAGIQLDYSEVDIAPRENLHLAFLLDGARLPSGDTFAAVFATTVPAEASASVQTVRVGALLVISNGTPSAHEAIIQNLAGDMFQFGDGLSFSFDVHNTASLDKNTGFSPTITVSAWPYINDTVAGPLIFAGRTRDVEYVKTGNYLGLLAIKVKTGDSEQTMYRLVITGNWRFLFPILIVLAAFAIWLAGRVHKRLVN
jgi:hypothetical protein